MNDPVDNCRWYLCTEERPGTWECKQTERETVQRLDQQVKQPKQPTRAIMVYDWKPVWMDALEIHGALHPTVRIVR
jgi:hypothetical protein